MTRETEARRNVASWLQAATEDGRRRGLPDLVPLLEGLAEATVALRTADWNVTVPLPPDVTSGDEEEA